MKNLRKHQLIAIGSSMAALDVVICLVALASAASRTERPAPVDAEQYADFMGNEVLDIQDLAEGAEVQRRMFNRITPPGLSWTQPMFPPVAPFDAQYFDEQFLEGLLGEDKNSVAIYPLSLIQDPKTRETLIYNAEGELIAAIPADRGSREWPADADPSRVILQLDLLPAEDVEPYLYTERRIEESLARYNASRSAKSGGAATRGLEAGEFGFVDMQILSNGNVQLTVTNGADVVEVFAYTVWHTSSVVVVTWTNEQSNVVTDTNTVWHQVSPAFNGLESAWECLTTNLVLTNGVGIYEDANISSNARIRFYAVANRQDTDGDGLTDGAEIFVHHTNPGNPDTDGDGWSDAEELAAGTEPLDRFSATKLARDVVLNEVLYNATGPDLGYEWIELYCAGRYPVNLGNFVIQVADTAYSNAYVFPSNTWIEPGRFLLLGGSNVPNRDLEVNFRMPNRFTNDPTAAVRIVAETGTNTVVVDCLMYGGSASNFNPYGLDTTGWISSHALSAGAGRSLYRRFNGHDTDQVWDWWYTENPTPNPFADISDSDGDGLTDQEELTGSRNPYGEPTNPHNADSDGDGLSDYAECITHGTNPNTWATDGDIYPWPPPSGAVSDWWGSDSYEIANGWNPLVFDENTNGIPDSWEMAFPGTSLYEHADNDGIPNYDELMQNSDPHDPDSHTAQPYVIRYESSMPGWVNDGMTDIGLEGWVKTYFEGLKTDMDLCVWVKEGRTQEQFRVEWRGATQKGIHWFNDYREVVTGASAGTNTRPYLLVQDLGQRPDFTSMLGGEYKIGILKIDMMTPAGDPVNSPVDGGDGSGSVPDGANEFTFSPASPGVLTLKLKARVTPSGIASRIKDQVHFTVDGIGASTMAWAVANLGGRPTASGDDLLATVTFTGLPANNTDFGAKKAAVYFDSCKQNEKDYEVYFPKQERNHPGTGSGSTPNWHYYWAGAAVPGYDLTSGTYSYADGGAGDYAQYNGNPNNPHYTIHGPASAGHEQYNSAGLNVDRKGIDTCAATLVHEKQHRQTDLDWLPGGAWFGKTDSDGDELPDDWEDAHTAQGFDKTKASSFTPAFIYGDDEEVWCEMNALGSTGDGSKDWANPGKQSKTVF